MFVYNLIEMLKVRLFLFVEKTAVSVQRCVNLSDMTWTQKYLRSGQIFSYIKKRDKSQER